MTPRGTGTGGWCVVGIASLIPSSPSESALAIGSPVQDLDEKRQELGYVPDWFGASFARLGDLDGDGVADFAVGSSLARQERGVVWVISGEKRTPIHRIQGPVEDGNLGTFVGEVGDVDQDGIRDIAAGGLGRRWRDEHGSRRSGMVLVYSGATSKTLLTLDSPIDGVSLGDCAADAGDLDGDERPDLAVSADALRFTVANVVSRRIFLVSSSTGRSLGTIRAPDGSESFGTRLFTGSDTDGDGLPELYTSGAFADRLGYVCTVSPRGAKQLFLERPNPSRLHRLEGFTAADIDLDDQIDLFAIRAGETPEGFVESIEGWSGAGGASLALGVQPLPQWREIISHGNDLAVLDDLDKDGWADHAISCVRWTPTDLRGLVVIRSGRSGLVLRTLRGEPGESEIYYGRTLCAIGDVDGDTMGDLLVGELCWDAPAIPGRVYIHSGKTGAEIARLRARDCKAAWSARSVKPVEDR